MIYFDALLPEQPAISQQPPKLATDAIYISFEKTSQKCILTAYARY